MPDHNTVVVAGATGNLGGRLISALIEEGANVRALVRPGTPSNKTEKITSSGADVVEADLNDVRQVGEACAGASCVVSALAGLRDVIVDTQQTLLKGAELAGVPRFIPSDFSANYTLWPQYENRTLDLRREFKTVLDKAAIRPTSILNGAFLDLLVLHFPAFSIKSRTVTYWGDADKRLEFTKIGDIAGYAAQVALDSSTPRMLRIVGERISARELAMLASELSGQNFELVNGGDIESLSDAISRLQLASDPTDRSLYPDWQRKMYMRTMFTRSAEVEPIDNDRYPHLRWTSARQLLEQHFAAYGT